MIVYGVKIKHPYFLFFLPAKFIFNLIKDVELHMNLIKVTTCST